MFELPDKSNNSLTVGLFSGILSSDCLLPCTKTTPIVVEGARVKMNSGESFFSFTFSDNVEIRKTTLDQFSFQESLNFLGSNLGLWTGMGAFQILEWIVVYSVFQKIIMFANGNKRG